MQLKLFVLILLFVTLGSASAQPDLEEKVRAGLKKLDSYKAEFRTELFMRPDAPPQEVTGVIEGRRPNLMRLQVDMEAQRVEMTTLMVFDGEWQWVDAKQQTESNLQRKILKIDAGIARPGAPFDTFYYYSGSGFLAGEDYLSTFERVLELYDFEFTGEKDGMLVLSGTLIEDKYKEYLADRDQLALAEILSVDSSMAECRLYVDPETSLPIGYDMGEDVSKPDVILRAQVTPNPDLPSSTFTFQPAEGWWVYDATAEIVEARLNAQKIEPGSDFFQAVSVFLERDDEMSEELSTALDNAEGEKIMALVKVDPKQLSTKSLVGTTVLTGVLEAGLTDLVKGLLDMGADVNQGGYGSETPLHKAARMGSVEVAKLLLERGANPEARNSGGATPLHLTSNPEMIELLLEAGASENVYDNYGSLPPIVSERGVFLLRAVQDGNLQKIDEYLNQGLTPDQSLKGPWGPSLTPLQGAALSGVPQLEHLLNRWKATGAERQQGLNELLSWAISPEVVAYLLEEGASASRVSLMKIPAPATAMALLEAGADPLEQNKNGGTPLLYCLTRSQLFPESYELAEKLIAAGDSVNRLFVVENQKEDLGKLALIHLDATEPERLEALLALGAEVDLPTEKGWTALHLATTFDGVESMELLYSKGASLTTREENGWTPLHSAAYLNQKRALKFLLSHQKDLNIQDKAGNTALHLASHLGRADIVQVLLDHGADPAIKNADGETAEDLGSK
ncbi:MAG: ankyrin repeat domain-containing protein [Candidatus Eremiobacteraeota bacterium]|nr:ankyrin repeat domain-containing protein [Candidatus Eremiobacteraeota bacterium]